MYVCVLQFKITIMYFNIFKNVMYSWVGKTEFPAAITPKHLCSSVQEHIKPRGICKQMIFTSFDSFPPAA